MKIFKKFHEIKAKSFKTLTFYITSYCNLQLTGGYNCILFRCFETTEHTLSMKISLYEDFLDLHTVDIS